MKNQIFCTEIAKNGLKIEEKCQKMSKKISFSFFFSQNWPKNNYIKNSE